MEEIIYRIAFGVLWVAFFVLRLYFQGKVKRAGASYTRINEKRESLFFRLFALAYLLLPLYFLTPWIDFAHFPLPDWARWGADKPNVLGLMAVQWSGNMLDDWVPDFLAAADDGWQPPEPGPVYGPQMARVRRHLARLADAAHPNPAEVDRHAWDGIWLRDGTWYEDVMSGMRRA